MMTLRERTKRAILEQLDKSFFTKDGFDCRFNEGDTTVSIKFRDNDQYYFKIKEQTNHRWIVHRKPGDTFVDEQKISLDTFEEATKRIDTWLFHINEELTLRSNDQPRVFDTLRERMNEQADALLDPERPFSKAEAVMWEQRLDSFVAQIQQLQKDQKVSLSLVNNIQSEVDKLKNQINSIPKRTWVKSAGLRVLEIIESIAVSEGRELVERAVRGLIGDGS